MGMLVFLMIYNLMFLFYEVPEIYVLKLSFFNDTWNNIDMIKILTTFLYLLHQIDDDVLDKDENDANLIAAIAVLFNWFRLIGFFRVIPMFRYYIRMIIEITKQSVPFLILFFSFVLAFTFVLIGLRGDDFEDTWMISYRLSYGDFEEEYVGEHERFIFVLATIALPLILLNLIIAIMSDIYERVSENQAVADVRERLSWIMELTRFNRWGKPRLVLMHQCKVSTSDWENDEWEGRL
jgi:hypothetical protein